MTTKNSKNYLSNQNPDVDPGIRLPQYLGRVDLSKLESATTTFLEDKSSLKKFKTKQNAVKKTLKDQKAEGRKTMVLYAVMNKQENMSLECVFRNKVNAQETVAEMNLAVGEPVYVVVDLETED